jgi:hypothetical protein
MNGANTKEIRAEETVAILNRLLALLRYSLASYLRYARPWTHPGSARLLEAVRQVAADHEDHARRIVGLIRKRRGTIEPSGFSTRFAAYNDLALDYLARRLVEHERELIEGIGRCVAGLGGDPETRLMAEGILAREMQHFQTLTELVGSAPLGGEAHPVTDLAA